MPVYPKFAASKKLVEGWVSGVTSSPSRSMQPYSPEAAPQMTSPLPGTCISSISGSTSSMSWLFTDPYRLLWMKSNPPSVSSAMTRYILNPFGMVCGSPSSDTGGRYRLWLPANVSYWST